MSTPSLPLREQQPEPMTAERLIEVQALRDDVRRKSDWDYNNTHFRLAGHRSVAADWYRLTQVLDEGDELQAEVTRRLPPEQAIGREEVAEVLRRQLWLHPLDGHEANEAGYALLLQNKAIHRVIHALAQAWGLTL